MTCASVVVELRGFEPPDPLHAIDVRGARVAVQYLV